MGWAVLARWTAAGEQAGAPGRRAAPARPQIQLQIQRSMRRRRQEPRPQFGKEVARGSLAWASVAGALRGNGRGSASSGGPFVVRWPLRGAGWLEPAVVRSGIQKPLPGGGYREAVAERRLPRGGPRGACGGAWAVDVGLTVGTTADTPEAASTNGGSRSSNPPHEQIGASSTKTRGSSKPQAFVPLYGRLADGGRGSVEGIRGRSRRRPIVEPFDAPTLLPLPP